LKNICEPNTTNLFGQYKFCQLYSLFLNIERSLKKIFFIDDRFLAVNNPLKIFLFLLLFFNRDYPSIKVNYIILNLISKFFIFQSFLFTSFSLFFFIYQHLYNVVNSSTTTSTIVGEIKIFTTTVTPLTT